MDIVIIESPYAGNTERNVAYARAALHDCLQRGEAPFASHLLYTQPGVLDDAVAAERDWGIRAGFEFRKHAAKTVVYEDLGVTAGMCYGIHHALDCEHVIEYRTIKGWHADEETDTTR